MSRELLPLIGLCFRARALAVGEEPVDAAVRAGDARVLLLAADAADNTVRRTARFAGTGKCPWLRLPYTKAELGRAVGRTSAAILAVTDIGFAANIVRRLAAEDDAQYGEAAAELERKNRRAAARRAEQKAHEKALRQGRAKKKKPSPETAAGTPAPPKKVKSEKRGKGPSVKAPAPRRGGPGGPRTGEAVPAGRFRGSRPVKKGKGSFRKKAAGPKS